MDINNESFDLSHFDLLIFDMDGVFYQGSEPIEYAAESITKCNKLNKQIAFFTNNSTLTREAYVQKLSSMKIKVHVDQIYTSSIILAKTVSKQFKTKQTIFVIGEDGLLSALCDDNHALLNTKYSLTELIQNDQIRCDLVVIGLDRNLSYNKMAAATQLINRGAKFYATNTDSSLPSEYGLLPGAGSIVDAIAVATGKKPAKVFGKPSPDGVYQILDDYKISPNKAILIGDRLETDILCAKNAGIKSLLVLTGVTTETDILSIKKDFSPDFILKNLSEL